MALNSKIVVPFVLVACGFAGGFALGGEASRHVTFDKVARAPAEGGGGAGGAGLGAGGAGGAGRHGGGAGGGAGAGPGGGGATAAGATAAGGNDAASAAVGKDRDAAEAAPAAGGEAAAQAGTARREDRPCPSVEVSGVEAAAVLAGNTVDDPRKDVPSGHVFTYFAPRGLVGRLGPTTITVRPWNPRAAVLCEPGEPNTGARTCDTLRVRRCTDATGPGATAGELLRPDGRWARIVAGNAQNFPSYIPLLDAVPPRPAPAARAAPATRARRLAPAFDATRTYAMPQSDAEPDGLVVSYAADGRRLDFVLPSAEQVEAGVEVALGWWTLDKGTLCQGRGARGRNGSCARPRARPGGRVVLASSGRAAVELLPLADLAPIRPRDRDG